MSMDTMELNGLIYRGGKIIRVPRKNIKKTWMRNQTGNTNNKASTRWKKAETEEKREYISEREKLKSSHKSWKENSQVTGERKKTKKPW